MRYQTLVAYGVARLTAGMAALLLSTQPVFIALLAALWLRERPPFGLYVELLVSLLGVALLVGTGAASGGEADVSGAAMVLGAAVAFAVYSVLSRPLTRRYSALRLTAWYTAMGTLALSPFVWLPTPVVWRAPDAAGWAAALLLGPGCTVGSVLLWNHGLSRVPAAEAGIYLYLVPLLGVLGGAVFLGERVGPSTLMAGAMIVAGVGLSTRAGWADSRAGMLPAAAHSDCPRQNGS